MSARHGIEVAAATNAREAIRGVDIVSICTSTNEPVFQNSWLEPGMHVTNLTSADVEPSLPRMVDVAIRAGEATPRLARTTEQAFYGVQVFWATWQGRSRSETWCHTSICRPRLSTCRA